MNSKDNQRDGDKQEIAPARLPARAETSQEKKKAGVQNGRPRSSARPRRAKSSSSDGPSYYNPDRWEEAVQTHQKKNHKDTEAAKGDHKKESLICGDAAEEGDKKKESLICGDVAEEVAEFPGTTSGKKGHPKQHPQQQQVERSGADSSSSGTLPTTTTTANGNSSTTSDDQGFPGAFRMRPASTPVPATEYDASDDFPLGSRHSVRDATDKEETLRVSDDILIEATLVEDHKAEHEDSQPLPALSYNNNTRTTMADLESPKDGDPPEIVTAEPIPKRFQLREAEEEERRRIMHMRRSVGGLLCVLVVFLIVASCVLGVQLNKDDNNHEINGSGQQFAAVATLAPTMAPTLFTQDMLPSYTQETLKDPESPQSAAYTWLQDNGLTSEAHFPLQLFTLATLYYATNGDQWKEQEHWLDANTDPCDWYTSFYGSICIGGLRRLLRGLSEQPSASTGLLKQHYQRLSLFQLDLAGSLPKEMGLLSRLDVINLHGNQIAGPVPSQLGLLQDVTLLQLFNNSLTGTLPTEIGQLSSIRHLNFAFNQISGSIPSQLAALATMEVFSVSNNQVTGSIPSELGLLTNLNGLHLYHNPKLGGSVPTELGMLQASEVIQLENTNVQGLIPSSLGQLSLLTKLTMHNTNLSGEIPVEVCRLMETGSLLELTVDCGKVTCTSPCQCDCTKSSSYQLQVVEDAVAETVMPELAGEELITDPPIMVSGLVGLTEEMTTEVPGAATEEDSTSQARPAGEFLEYIP